MQLDRRNYLEVISCPTTGFPGLMLKGMKRHEGMFTDGGEGVSIAHDLVEHINGVKAIGSVGDELEAFGAMWFVRGHLADFEGNHYSPEQIMGMEYGSLSRYFGYAPLRASVERELRCRADLDEIWEAIEPHALKSIDAEDLDESMMDEYVRASRILFKRGHMKAERRYKDSIAANNQFHAIRRAVTSLPEFYEDDVGRRFELRWGDMEASIREYGSDMTRYF